MEEGAELKAEQFPKARSSTDRRKTERGGTRDKGTRSGEGGERKGGGGRKGANGMSLSSRDLIRDIMGPYTRRLALLHAKARCTSSPHFHLSLDALIE